MTHRDHVHRLFRALSSNPERVALVFGDRSYSFGELDEQSRRYASGLRRLGIGRGDRVAVFAETSPEVVVALLGHHRLGAIHVPINNRYQSEEAGHVLRDSGAKAVLYNPGSGFETVVDGIGPVAGLQHFIELPDSPPGRTSCAVPFSRLLEAPPLESGQAGEPEDADIALLIYTSGTTGKSKGVALSFGALTANIGSLTELWRFSCEDRLALALPLFHVHGLCIGIHGALLNGLTVLLYEKFDAGRIVEAFSKRGASVFMGVPTMYVRLLEHLSAFPEAAGPLAKARLFTSGSAPLPADDFDAFLKATGHAILERYGMSETLFSLSNPYEGEPRPGTVGLPVPGYDVRIVDDSGADVANGELGEVVVRGAGLMTGYWGKPEETAASFRDGWFQTGDVARRDEDGYVTLVGRKSTDIIKSGGFKISAREIEDVLRRHPAVKEVAVVGAPDRLWGQRIVAAVVLSEGTEREPDGAGFQTELAEFASGFLADYKRPREVIVLPELPRNALGKVQKHLLVRSEAGHTQEP